MWTCRKCSSEVDDGFEICWSCGTSVDGQLDPTFRRSADDQDIALALETTPAPMTAEGAAGTATAEKPVTVATYWVARQAQEVQALLEARAIPVVIAYDFAIGINLQVPSADVERTRKVLADNAAQTTPLPPPPPKPAEPDEEEKYKDQPWEAPLPRDVSTEETLRFLESQVSALIDSKDVPDWKVNPSYHPDVIAFIQKRANNMGFVQRAQKLQRNRASYYATMRAQSLVPKALEPDAPAAPPKPALSKRLAGFGKRYLVQTPARLAKRGLKWAVILLVAGIFLFLAGAMGYRSYGDKQLLAANNEADEKDPGWDWFSLQEKREPKTIPDAENGALVVQAVASKLPESSVALRAAVRSQELNVPLNETDLKRVQQELDRQQAVVAEARRLATLPYGRFPETAPGGTALANALAPKPLQNVAWLLYLDSIRAVEEGKTEQALNSALAVLNAGRASGDAPDAAAQEYRANCRFVACKAIERILAHQPALSDETLAQLQQRLADEEAVAIIKPALRGHRLWTDDALGQIEANHLQAVQESRDPFLATQYLNASLGLGGFENWLKSGWIKDNRAKTLRLLSRAVEIANMPAEDQSAPLNELLQQGSVSANGYRYYLVPYSVSVAGRIAQNCQRSQMELRTLIALIAAERYRLANGAWPSTLGELVPKYLPAVPVDIFGKKPVVLRRLDDRLIVYSVGPDQQDDGGALAVDPGTPEADAKDVGFRLWDLARRAPSVAEKP